MKEEVHTRFIVVSGGVISGVGKGLTTASLGKIFTEYGYATTLIKIDPYINYDAGTLRPTEHGEVWVTEDGGEIDQDLGTYERFINSNISKFNSITTGQIYKAVIDKERRGEYLGQTVQLIPHITNEIIARIQKAAAGYDIAIIEIGGIVGDYENIPFLYALKSLERDIGSQYVAHVLVTYLPVPSHIGEMKTKPTQQAVKMLSEQGIFPDSIICRAHVPIDEVRKEKIETFANVRSDQIIAAPDIDCVYQMPLVFEEQKLGDKFFTYFQLVPHKVPDWSCWLSHMNAMVQKQNRLRIAVVGKYINIGDYHVSDSYLSIEHALIHAAAALNKGVDIIWIDATQFENASDSCKKLASCDGVIVPGGFGQAGVEGMMRAISYVRTHDIPFLGICYGLQLAAVEFARNVCNLSGAHTSEVDEHTPHPIVTILPYQKQVLEDKQVGGSMRLGSCKAYIRPHTRVYQLYQDHIINEGNQSVIFERHRHRYEINPDYVDILSVHGLVFSGYHVRGDGKKLMEFFEIPLHPFFVATQAHPEFKSRFVNPSPLFYGLVSAALQYQERSTLRVENTIKSHIEL